ncbi:MAG TPA: choice-of-anchor tandem repeat GloVer-containing protein [Candidatus Sulfotelmatobacter sp.]|jgi:uncharacterized repeat protein (TIGR03803 family)
MKTSKSRPNPGLALVCATIILALAVCAQAQTVTNLADFNGNDGYFPQGAVVQATDGNFYGVTENGGVNRSGNVFKLTPAGKLSSFYDFCSTPNCADGADPRSGPIVGSDGNFYGVVYGGGNAGQGTFYKMTMRGKLTTLYTFCTTSSCLDGSSPGGIIQASDGNFYGTTAYGGNFNGGTIFEISSAGKFKLLYTFCAQANCADGKFPYFPPIQASNGSLYGATTYGGTSGYGVVYEITPAGKYKVIHSFCYACIEGWVPTTIVQDANGNFFGTTSNGGDFNYGTVFEITSSNQYVVLHSFNNTDGAWPVAGLTVASDGNLYGMTWGGGATGNGAIFQITPAGVFTSIYSFCDLSCGTGTVPDGWLFQATNGTIYGTTTGGENLVPGNVFSLSNNLSPMVKTVPVAGRVGERVIILGSGLTGSSNVTFNGTPAAFRVASDTEITTTVPTGATSGAVSVVTAAGTLNSNPAFQITK